MSSMKNNPKARRVRLKARIPTAVFRESREVTWLESDEDLRMAHFPSNGGNLFANHPKKK